MSIIFQLFSAEDLQKLEELELLELSRAIRAALNDPINRLPIEDGKLHLNLRQKVEPNAESPAGLNPQPKWVQEALLKRFHEVSHQLKTPPLDLSQQPFDFEKLFEERNDPKTQSTEKLILNWAITCELNHLEFYVALLVAKQAADEFFEDKAHVSIKRKLLTPEQQKNEETEKVRFKDPDSVYSPFNPRHPGYKQYFDVLGSGPGTTGQTTSSSS
jgi:hypothetical protein